MKHTMVSLEAQKKRKMAKKEINKEKWNKNEKQETNITLKKRK